MRGARWFRLAFLLAILAAPVSFAQTTGNVLTNADVVKMMKAGLPESIIVRVIQTSRTDFSATPAGLIELKKHGASETILGAVLDSQAGPAYPAPEQLAAPGALGQYPTSRPHHLPSFEADLKVNNKVHEKVSMGQNHIEVKQGRTPVFSLTWKTPTEK